MMEDKMNEKDMKHLMISYQWDSQKQIIKLRDKLKQEGYKIWIDIDKMEGDILESMGKAVENAAAVLICTSKKYQESKSCKTEAEYAFTKNIPVIPIKVEGNFEPSSWLGALVGSKLYHCIDTDELLNKNFPGLIRDLGDRGRQTPAAKPTKLYSRRARKALECSVCLERYRNPKTLPCLHSFCRDCLLLVAPSGTKTVSCPQCREEATVPDGDATKFKSNFHLQELAEEAAIQEQLNETNSVDISKSFTCTCCDAVAQSKVVAKCQDCNHYLCESGLDAHQRFSALRKHGVLVFQHTNQANESPSTPSMPTHGTTDKPTQLQTTEWEIFNALFNEDHSGYLLKYWIQRNGGGRNWQTAMVDQYTTCLRELEEDGVISDAALLKRQEQVARLFMQAGQYDEALQLVQKTVCAETKELGERPDKLADLYGLVSTIHLEISKQEDYINDRMLPTLREVIRYARKSIKLRKGLEGVDHKYKLGKMLIILTFALSDWIECGCDAVLRKHEAVDESKRHIEHAIQIFKELDSKGNRADAIMTKALFAEGNEEEELYMDAHKLCLEAYGECSVLTRRLNLNIGIMYERRYNSYKAYRWFVKCEEITEKVYGYHHKKTEQIRRIFEEPQYALIKKQLSESK